MRLVLCLLLGGAAIPGQNSRPAYPTMEVFAAWNEGNYLAPLMAFREKRDQLTKLAPGSSDAQRGMRAGYLQSYAAFTSAAGNCREALEAQDDSFPEETGRGAGTHEVEKAITGLKPESARRVLLELAAKNRAVFINEAHHVPQHRAFTISLLRDLWKLGYRYFAAETLNDDAELIKRGYPAIGKTGHYTNEPIYGDLVRTAMRLGYRIVPYEHVEATAGEDMMSQGFQRKRDREQAANLAERVFRKDPEARLVVHAGYMHIHEKETPYWSPMAMHFRQLTGIDPLTVDQTEMAERSSAGREAAVYRYAEARWKFREPVVLRDSRGTAYVGGDSSGFVDLQVFSPRSVYVHGRPDWLRLAGSRNPHSVRVDDLKGGFPYMVQARSSEEGRDAVPVDQVELTSAARSVTLWLPKGAHTVTVRDRAGTEVRSANLNARPER